MGKVILQNPSKIIKQNVFNNLITIKNEINYKIKLIYHHFVMLFLFSVIGFWGCEKDSLSEAAYSEYLDLQTYSLSEMSAEDMEIIGQAFQRLDIDRKNGLYQIKQTSGAMVNISDNLFNFIKEGFEFTNKICNPNPSKFRY